MKNPDLYFVELLPGHTAREDQQQGRYLANEYTGKACRYTRGEAIKKARMFGGKIEAVSIWENQAYREYNRTKGHSAFSFIVNSAYTYEEKRRLNQHATRYTFADKSKIIISDTSNQMTCYNTHGNPQAVRAVF